MPKVKFINEKVEVEVAPGANLRLVALENGIAIHHHGFGKPSRMAAYLNCSTLLGADLIRKVLGPKSKLAELLSPAFCGTCHVYIKSGMENCSKKGIKESVRLCAASFTIGHESEVRLACQTHVMGDIEVQTAPPANYFGEEKFWQ
jgi:ferredoxin